MMGKVIMSGIVPPLVAPVTGIQLGTIAEGSIVKLNENGSPVEFYVAKHDYESALNGSGRTLLVRKDCYDKRPWHSSQVNAYATSAIDAWLNGDYKAMLDEDVQSVIGSTSFYYTTSGNGSAASMARSVFILSVGELGLTHNYANYTKEGSALPIASVLKIAYKDGTAVKQWTRSPRLSGTTSACFVYESGSVDTLGCNSVQPASRPCFTLPSGALFDETTMLFNGKIA